MANTKKKGKEGELEWAQYLRSKGFDARRSKQYKGTNDSFDVLGNDPVGNWEVKRVQAMSLHPVVANAREEADGDLFAVAWRKNRGRWIVAMDADDFFRMIDTLKERDS